MTQHAVNPRKRDLAAEKLDEIKKAADAAPRGAPMAPLWSPMGYTEAAVAIGAPHASKPHDWLDQIHAAKGGPLGGPSQALVVEFDEEACTQLKDTLDHGKLLDASAVPGTYWGVATDFKGLIIYKQSADADDMEQQDCILLFIILQMCIHIYIYPYIV